LLATDFNSNVNRSLQLLAARFITLHPTPDLSLFTKKLNEKVPYSISNLLASSLTAGDDNNDIQIESKRALYFFFTKLSLQRRRETPWLAVAQTRLSNQALTTTLTATTTTLTTTLLGYGVPFTIYF